MLSLNRSNRTKKKICDRKHAKAAHKSYKQDRLIRKQQAHEEQIDELDVEPPPKRFASNRVVGDRKFSNTFSRESIRCSFSVCDRLWLERDLRHTHDMSIMLLRKTFSAENVA